nr:hypothetical protein [Tanacetum cinerariifolium]
MTSDATLHVYFILERSSHFKDSPGALLRATFSCSALSIRKTSDCRRYITLSYFRVDRIVASQKLDQEDITGMPSSSSRILRNMILVIDGGFELASGK